MIYNDNSFWKITYFLYVFVCLFTFLLDSDFLFRVVSAAKEEKISGFSLLIAATLQNVWPPIAVMHLESSSLNVTSLASISLKQLPVLSSWETEEENHSACYAGHGGDLRPYYLLDDSWFLVFGLEFQGDAYLVLLTSAAHYHFLFSITVGLITKYLNMSF